jgi:hypothetical protein
MSLIKMKISLLNINSIMANLNQEINNSSSHTGLIKEAKVTIGKTFNIKVMITKRSGEIIDKANSQIMTIDKILITIKEIGKIKVMSKEVEEKRFNRMSLKTEEHKMMIKIENREEVVDMLADMVVPIIEVMDKDIEEEMIKEGFKMKKGRIIMNDLTYKDQLKKK